MSRYIQVINKILIIFDFRPILIMHNVYEDNVLYIITRNVGRLSSWQKRPAVFLLKKELSLIFRWRSSVTQAN